jgi:LPXTG-site transpeptidase (sortase) family protein
MAAGALMIGATACGGGGKAKPTPTDIGQPTLTATQTPASAGLKSPIAISPGGTLTQEDLAARGVGEPGRGDFTGDKLVIDKIGVDAPFTYRVVAGDGQMPNPDGPEDVAYYDFSQWPLKGGLPGKGGNVVIAGHVDYIRYGPAVFWRLRELEPGDLVTIKMKDGSEVSYKIEFNKVLENVADADWSAIVGSTADESITLITCAGQFAGGEYNNRQIAWGRKV